MNKTVILTRSSILNQEIISSLRDTQINFLSFPLYSVKQITELKKDQMGAGEWCFFTSQNAVFKETLELTTGTKIACIGNKTANLIESFGYKVSFIPKISNEESFVTEFLEIHLAQCPKVTVFHGSTSSKYISDVLSQNNIKINNTLCYEIIPTEFLSEQDDEIIESLLVNPNNEIKEIYFSLLSIYAVKLFFERKILNDKLLLLMKSNTSLKINFLTIGQKTYAYLRNITNLPIINYEEPDIEEAIFKIGTYV